MLGSSQKKKGGVIPGVKVLAKSGFDGKHRGGDGGKVKSAIGQCLWKAGTKNSRR